MNMPDMNEHFDEGIIHAWLDGALAPDESARIERHVLTCVACGGLVAEARGLIAASSRILASLDDVPAGAIPGRGNVDQLAALRAKRAGTGARRAWWRQPGVGIAASLLLVAGVGTAVWRSGAVEEAVTEAASVRAATPVVDSQAPVAREAASDAAAPPATVRSAPEAPRLTALARDTGVAVERDAMNKVAPAAGGATTSVAIGTQQSVTPQAAGQQRTVAAPPPQAAVQQELRTQALQGRATDSVAISAFGRSLRREAVPQRLADAPMMAARAAPVTSTECFELRGAEPARVRLLNVPDRVELTTSRSGDNVSLSARIIGERESGVSLAARASAADSMLVELVVRRPLDSTLVRFSRSPTAIAPIISPADSALGVVAASARRVVC
jgi:hypothetical protein